MVLAWVGVCVGLFVFGFTALAGGSRFLGVIFMLIVDVSGLFGRVTGLMFFV